MTTSPVPTPELPVCGVIPAYKPERKLTAVVDEALRIGSLSHLVVVDDASGEAFREVFDELAARPGVTVLRHAVNQGTGGATKTAFNHILLTRPETAGVVTFDADGQHLPSDVRKVADAFRQAPGKLAIGVRDFHDAGIRIPLRSKLGNRITELIFAAFTGIRLKDTQTGLRCYNREMVKACLTIPRNRYEFQLEALLLCAREHDIVQVPIETIYEDGNRCSHFNPLLDSIRIYLVFFRFIGAVLICAVADYLIFALLMLLECSIFTSLLSARVFSVALNFFLSRNKVFRSKGNIAAQAVKFTALAVFLFCASWFSITLLKEHLGWPPLLSKLLVETTLFFCSFLVQNLLIFTRRR